MVETLITTVFLTIVAFAALQLVIMVVNDMSMNEAAFAASRVAVVSKGTEIEEKMRNVAAVLLAPEFVSAGRDLIPQVPEVQGASVAGIHSGTYVQICSTNIKYMQRIMFGPLLGGPRIMSNGNVTFLKNTARAKMVKSPDEEYYDKAYPNAPNF